MVRRDGGARARRRRRIGARHDVQRRDRELNDQHVQRNDCSDFLETHGQSGRILVDQPALWTENEGGFQVWGGAPPPGQEPYFWGRPIADQALSVMKWFARGGSHMDYYMWAGGSNFGRWTGDAITTMYAADAIVCPDGLPHEPKFAHTSAMHAALAAAAADVMAADAQLDKAHKLGKGAIAFAYGDYAFLEADKSDANVTWRGHAYHVPAQSSTLVRSSTGEALFNSKLGAPSHSATEARRVAPLGALTGWKAWAEPITSAAAYPPTAVVSSSAPVEMTNVTRGSHHICRLPGAPERQYDGVDEAEAADVAGDGVRRLRRRRRRRCGRRPQPQQRPRHHLEHRPRRRQRRRQHADPPR